MTTPGETSQERPYEYLDLPDLFRLRDALEVVATLSHPNGVLNLAWVKAEISRKVNDQVDGIFRE